MAICKDCGCSFSDMGNMPLCPDCIEAREEKVCKDKKACEEAKCAETYAIGVPAKSVDPWIHRSSGMRCRTCMWFVGKAVPEGSKSIGRCRRHAPSMNGYPVVYENDWCGDHKVDETKI